MGKEKGTTRESMIFVFGDSWSAKWQEYNPWPSILESNYGIPTKNFGIAGASNGQILDRVSEESINYPNEQVDLVIVAFTSVDRMTLSITDNVELCVSGDYQSKSYAHFQKVLFEETDLKSLLFNTWLKLHAIKTIVKATWNCDVIFLPVFEDCEYWRRRNFKPSLMNICHYKQHSRYFAYDAPVYEVGLMQMDNNIGTEWCKKYLGNDYERAYFERTNYCTSSNWFDNSLHPTQAGHDAIADYFVNDVGIMDK